MKLKDITLVQDTREQLPLTLPHDNVIVKGLKTGDYSIEGFEDVITFEHKSVKDLIGTCGLKNRERFRRELQRMKDGYSFYCIVISGKESDVLPTCEKTYKIQQRDYYAKKNRGIKCRPPMRPEVRALSVMGSLRAFRVDFNAHFYFLGTREKVAEWIVEQAKYFVRHK